MISPRLTNLTVIPAYPHFEFKSIKMFKVCILIFILFSIILFNYHLLQLLSVKILRVRLYPKMLAIYEGRVATRPLCMMMPHDDSVPALKNAFLANHFTTVYPDSVVVSFYNTFTFAYSLGTSSSSRQERNHFDHVDGVYCMYQGVIKDVDTVKRDFHISEIDDEGILMIRAFQILRRLGQRIPKRAVDNLFRNCVAVFYEVSSKLVVLAAGSDHSLPTYWGIDTRFNIVISSDEKVVKKACGCAEEFLSGQVYACCKYQTGKDALFLNKQLPFKLDFTDHYFPVPELVEAIVEMLLKADKERRNVTKWEPPLPDFLKINTDVFEIRGGVLGIGIVVRNSKGDVQYASTRRARNTIPNLDPEFQAFIEGFYVAAGFKIPRCICESIHLNLEKIDKNRVSAIIEQKLHTVGNYVLDSLREFSVSFVKGSANTAAYRLAVLAETEIAQHRFWSRVSPECIASIVDAERPKMDTNFPDEFLQPDAAEK